MWGAPISRFSHWTEEGPQVTQAKGLRSERLTAGLAPVAGLLALGKAVPHEQVQERFAHIALCCINGKYI
eukprot:1137150-Pelagomonas_calceolata.AAC.1